MVILASYAEYETDELKNHKPSLVFVDEKNRIIAQGAERVEESFLAAVR